jgi:hypothetical protein
MPIFGELLDFGLFGGEPRVKSSEAGRAPVNPDDWFVINGGAFDVYCTKDVDVATLVKRLDRQRLFISGVYGTNPTSVPAEKLVYMLGRLLKRAKEILEMYPSMPVINVKVFKDNAALSAEYFRIFGKDVDYKSFYIHQLRTIYTSQEDMSPSVIAHEMGHAVADHYFGAIPPPSVGEALASSVDKNLEY